MTLFDFSVWRVILAIVAYVLIGMFWYMPPIFGKSWMAALGKKKMNKQGTSILISVLSTIVIVLVFTYFANLMGVPTVWRGAYLGAKVWLGFVATTGLITSTFEGGSLQVLSIDLGYHLVGLVVAGIILAS
jgi:hypothetical protein